MASVHWYWSSVPRSEYFPSTNEICHLCLDKRIQEAQIITTKIKDLKYLVTEEYLGQLNDLTTARWQEKPKAQEKLKLGIYWHLVVTLLSTVFTWTVSLQKHLSAAVTLQQQLHFFTTRWKQTRMKRWRLQLRNMRQHPDKLKRVSISNLRFSVPFKISQYRILWKNRHTKYYLTSKQWRQPDNYINCRG